jgi:hypothetical protein
MEKEKEMKKPIHYEEAKDFDEIIDWDKVYLMDTWQRQRVLRGLSKPPMKKVVKDA